MGYFSKYRKYYKEPERYTSDIARERRLAAVMKREAAAVESLSRVKIKNEFVPRWKLVNDPETKGQKAASIAAALSQFKERDFAEPQARAAYRKLRQRQEELRSQQKVRPAGSDRRQYNPTEPFPSTVYGTAARFVHNLSRLPGAISVAKFAVSGNVIPCIERAVRREVLFALGKGGKGYKTPKRRNEFSGIPC